ncbi:MAG: MATE family efflux transporter [Oscillospiraceae bacterium]|nr:MATE family efflux transporter [Oscillospiraceae bacterium]
MSGARLRNEAKRDFILESNLIKVIFITALPQVISMLIDSVYNMADAFFVSQLGDAAISAVGINDSLLMIIRSVGMGFGMGSASFISRALGARKDEEASRLATTTLITAVGISAALVTIGSMFIGPLVRFLGASGAVEEYARDYARWILLSAPITVADTCLSQTLRAEGNTTLAMFGMGSGCIINIILDPIFINKLGMGVAGAAIATDISKVVSLVFLAMPYIRRRCIIILKPSYFTPSKKIYKELARMGIPVMLRSSMMSVSMIILNNVAASFGEAALAASSVAHRSLRLVGSGIMGFGHGFQPIAGYCWGAKKYSRALKAFWYTLTIGGILGFVLGGLLLIFAKQVILIFSSNPEMLSLGLKFIRSQSITLIPHVWVMIASGLFMAFGQPVRAGVMGMSRQLISLVPCILICSYFFGVTGLAYSQAIADVVSVTLALILAVPVIKQLRKLCAETDAAEAALADGQLAQIPQEK